MTKNAIKTETTLLFILSSYKFMNLKIKQIIVIINFNL